MRFNHQRAEIPSTEEGGDAKVAVGIAGKDYIAKS